MANHLFLFHKTKIAGGQPSAVSVTGELDTYNSTQAYESRLSINNAVGRCTVEIVSAFLPAGAFVRVDNITKEVVVKWAAYSLEPGELGVANGDFEAGDSGDWEKGPGWSIGTGPGYDSETGTFSARFADVTTGSSELRSRAVPAKLGDVVRATARVQQGASAKGSAGAGVSVVFLGTSGSEISRAVGNVVSSGKGGNWASSVAVGSGPIGTDSVAVVVSGFRKRENKPLWVDSVSWDHSYLVGQNTLDVYQLTLRVRDSANRYAEWSGSINPYIFIRPTTALFYGAVASVAASNTGSFSAGAVLPANAAIRGTCSRAGVVYYASAGNVRFSDDLVSWSSSEYAGFASSVLEVTDSGTLLLGTGSGFRRKVSGGSWETVTVSGMNAVVVKHHMGRVLAVGSPNVYTLSDTDGITWGALGSRLDTAAAAFNSGSGNFIAGAASGQFVLCGSIWGGPYGLSQFIPGVCLTAASGTSTAVTFHPIQVVAGVASCIVRCVRGEGEFWVAGGTLGRVWRADSPTGPWSLVHTFGNGVTVSSVSDDSVECFVSCGTSSAKSADGSVWSSVTSPPAPTFYLTINQ